MPLALDYRIPLPKTLSKVEIRRVAKGLMKELSIEERELSVVFCDDEMIHALNRDFREKDKPTDVLAFALTEGEFGALAGPLLGDVVISVPTTLRQAEEAGKTPMQELAMLLVHGTLHLLGWDHDTAKKDRLMRAETDRLLALVGVPGPSAPADPGLSTPTKGGKGTSSSKGTVKEGGASGRVIAAVPARSRGAAKKSAAKKTATKRSKS